MNDEECKEKALPCPFCGEKPKVDHDYWSTSMFVFCNCEANPSVSDKAETIINPGESVTYSPIWDYTNVLKKWNKRFN